VRLENYYLLSQLSSMIERFTKYAPEVKTKKKKEEIGFPFQSYTNFFLSPTRGHVLLYLLLQQLLYYLFFFLYKVHCALYCIIQSKKKPAYEISTEEKSDYKCPLHSIINIESFFFVSYNFTQSNDYFSHGLDLIKKKK